MKRGNAVTSESDVKTAPDAVSPGKGVERQLSRLEKARRRHRQPNMRIGFLLASWCILVPYAGFQTYTALSFGKWLDALMWGSLLVAATQLHRFTLSPEQTRAARELAQYNDVRGVGHLAEALEWPDAHFRKEAATALIGLLPRMKASDAPLLTPDQRLCLYERLNARDARSQPRLVIAILKALEQVGDEAGLSYVQKLAETAAPGGQKQVQYAARVCLPYMEKRVQEQRAHQTLLRASSAGGAAGEILLRPAEKGAGTEPAQLLRAGTGPDEPSDGATSREASRKNRG